MLFISFGLPGPCSGVSQDRYAIHVLNVNNCHVNKNKSTYAGYMKNLGGQGGTSSRAPAVHAGPCKLAVAYD